MVKFRHTGRTQFTYFKHPEFYDICQMPIICNKSHFDRYWDNLYLKNVILTILLINHHNFSTRYKADCSFNATRLPITTILDPFWIVQKKIIKLFKHFLHLKCKERYVDKCIIINYFIFTLPDIVQNSWISQIKNGFMLN